MTDQLRASHLILGCVPSYTNYQDSSGTLMIDSPLLSYFDVQLLEFLPHGLTCDKVKHQGPRRVRQGLLELIHNGLVDIVFQGRAVHIPVETPILDDHSSIQKVFGHPTSLYKVVFSMTNVLSIYDSFQLSKNYISYGLCSSQNVFGCPTSSYEVVFSKKNQVFTMKFSHKKEN